MPPFPGVGHITSSRSLLKLISIELVMPSNHLILCHPLLLSSVFPSIRVCSNEAVLRMRWPKYCSFSFSISPSNEFSGLISFRMDWLDLLAGSTRSLFIVLGHVCFSTSHTTSFGSITSNQRTSLVTLTIDNGEQEAQSSSHSSVAVFSRPGDGMAWYLRNSPYLEWLY